MSHNPHPRRRRPGRRPPNRYPGHPWPSSRDGFTGPGFRQIYQWMLPGLKGPEKKRFFNELSSSIVLAAGVCGTILGLIWFGWIGAILGLGAGIAAGGSFAESRRFHRD